MKISEMTEDKRNALEVAIKERAAKNGFDPESYWARYCKVWEDGHKLKVSEYQQLIIDEMHRRGWEKPAQLDYEAHLVYKEEDHVVDGADCWSEFVVNYGNSEGIYIDWGLNWYDEDGKLHTKKIGAFKTLGDNLDAAEQMGLLAGRLTWLSREIYW